MKHRELLAAISDLEPAHVQGRFERHSSLRWEELMASAAGGRWGARRAYEVLYLGRPRVLDLRVPAAQAALSLGPRQLASEVDDYQSCQAIGAAAHQLGLSGVIAPSASNLGETLALFTANLPVEHWPMVVARDIWRGLPSDPRVLRVVDDEAG